MKLGTSFSRPRLSALLVALCALSLPACTGNTRSTAPSNNISLMVSPTTNEVYVFDLLTHRVTNNLETGNRPDDLAVSSDSRRVLVSNINDGSISVIERQDGSSFINRGKVTVQGTQPQGVAFNPQGTEAYVSVGDTSSITVLNTSNPSRLPTVVSTIRIPFNQNSTRRPSPAQIAVSPDGQRLFVLDRGNNSVLALNRQQNTFAPAEFFLFPTTAPVDLRDIEVDRSGRLYVLNSANDELLIFNGANIQQQVARVSLRDQQFNVITPENIAINNSQTKLYITGSAPSIVSFIPNIQNLRGEVNIAAAGGRSIPLGLDPRRPATSPVGIDITSNDRLVYTSNGGGGYNISLLNGETDILERNMGTSASAANAPPLGRMKIVAFGTVAGLATGVRSLSGNNSPADVPSDDPVKGILPLF